MWDFRQVAQTADNWNSVDVRLGGDLLIYTNYQEY